MKMTIFKILILTFAAVVSGCAENFHARPDKKFALVKSLHDNGSMRMCKDGVVYSLSKSSSTNGYIRIPAEERISVGIVTDFRDAYVRHICTVFIEFKPEEGQRYIADANNNGFSCRIELVREDANTDTGLIAEGSLGRSTCDITGGGRL